MLTCYDLRFAEPALLNRERGAEIITYPSAFATRTGMAHWGESAGVLPSMSLWILPNPSLRPTTEPLLRARAIETQTYVLAAAQVGSHPPTSRSSYGAACIVDPWGSILAQVSSCDASRPLLCGPQLMHRSASRSAMTTSQATRTANKMRAAEASVSQSEPAHYRQTTKLAD